MLKLQRPITTTLRSLPRIAIQQRYQTQNILSTYQKAKMSNLAAIIPAAKAPIEVQASDIPTPGSNEVVIRNEALALNPIDAKIQKLAIFPMKYPATIGSIVSGTVHASSSDAYKPGDRVVASGSQAFRQYVSAPAATTVKLPSDYKFEDAAGIIINLATVFSAFDLYAKIPREGGKGKVLVYGGSSSVGGYAVQYAAGAGYDIVTTTSPGNKAYVESLGAIKVVDHTQSPDAVAKELSAAGPYDVIFDSIGLPATSSVLANVVSSSPSIKTIFSTLPSMDPSIKFPNGVDVRYYSYTGDLSKEENQEAKKYFYGTYLPDVFSGKKKIIPTRMEKADGGLKGVQNALDKLIGGVSGVKLWVNPQE